MLRFCWPGPTNPICSERLSCTPAFPNHCPTKRYAAPTRLDGLDQVLPFGRRLSRRTAHRRRRSRRTNHLAKEGMGDNSLRALTSDLAYLEAWCVAATGELPLAGSGSATAEIRGAASVGSRPEETDPGHGMPESLLRSAMPNCCVPTVRIRQARCAAACRAGRR